MKDKEIEKLLAQIKDNRPASMDWSEENEMLDLLAATAKQIGVEEARERVGKVIDEFIKKPNALFYIKEYLGDDEV